jgi:hypothetical protein
MITEALVDIAITQLHFGTSEHKPQKGMRKGLGSFDYGLQTSTSMWWNTSAIRVVTTWATTTICEVERNLR